MSPEDLALTDQNGETALSVAAVVDNLEAAKLLVNKNPELPYIFGKSGLPIHRAAQFGHRDMFLYLLSVTRDDIDPSPFIGKSGGMLIIAVITAEYFDIALKLVERYPDMATTEVPDMDSPLTVLASKSTAFPSGQTPTYNPVKLIWNCWQKKQIHRNAILLTRSLSDEILQLDDAKAFEMFREPLLIAAKLGTHEIIEEIVEAFPPAIWASDDENRNIFELAVLHRRENVFNLIYQMSNYKHLITRHTNKNDNNNILHLAGQLPSPDRLKLVSGSALQVQRELQWFEEVRKFVEPARKEAKNKDGKTPWMVFRETHQDLIKDGEKWMKSTATACTVASTLITTVVFSAAIRVPGGESNDGYPKLSHHWCFRAFAVTDSVSLFTSVTAVILFLSILTSRYSEGDFHLALPRRLIFGLMMLFISIISMTAAFSFAIYLLFGYHRSIIVIIVGALAVVGNLAWNMLPLLFQYFRSTLCCGIFGKQSDRILH
ncbi:ankyrin repeat-containing protein NPR4-like [Amaranthus tricolor]|nr:ankyrin repeat-containing protein NPR4-like [Amaranthus tricolor]